MKHPLEFIPQHLRKPLFYVFLVLTIVIFGVFGALDGPLRTSAAPSGVVSFELARDVETAQAIIDSWNADARLSAAFGLGLDYLFMPAYAFALSLGVLLAVGEKKSWIQSFAPLMGWGAFTAAVFDAVENYALWRLLAGNVVSPYPEVAALCATIKFIFLAAGLATIVASRIIRK